MIYKAWHSIEEVPYCFWSSIKFPGYMDPNINDFNPNLSKNIRPVAAIKSFRFALLDSIHGRIMIQINWICTIIVINIFNVSVMHTFIPVSYRICIRISSNKYVYFSVISYANRFLAATSQL